MSRMRTARRRFMEVLESPGWRSGLAGIAAGGIASFGPLTSFLPRGGELAARAAVAVGATVAALAETEPEKARNAVRQLMWRMNDESGNMGWGVPQAFAEILCQSPAMAREYHRILFSYVMDLGHDDNYCDNDMLRRSCFEAIARFASCRPDQCAEVRPWLEKGLHDRDEGCRLAARSALQQLENSGNFTR